MALFHLSVTQTKRSAGQSAIASAAYRAGERLYSEYYGEYSDYTRNSSRDLIDWLKLLKDETISDIRKIYKSGATDSVKEKYQKYINI